MGRLSKSAGLADNREGENRAEAAPANDPAAEVRRRGRDDDGAAIAAVLVEAQRREAAAAERIDAFHRQFEERLRVLENDARRHRNSARGNTATLELPVRIADGLTPAVVGQCSANSLLQTVNLRPVLAFYEGAPRPRNAQRTTLQFALLTRLGLLSE